MYITLISYNYLMITSIHLVTQQTFYNKKLSKTITLKQYPLNLHNNIKFYIIIFKNKSAFAKLKGRFVSGLSLI